jgi:hypothetical protein
MSLLINYLNITGQRLREEEFIRLAHASIVKVSVIEKLTVLQRLPVISWVLFLSMIP